MVRPPLGGSILLMRDCRLKETVGHFQDKEDSRTRFKCAVTFPFESTVACSPLSCTTLPISRTVLFVKESRYDELILGVVIASAILRAWIGESAGEV
jgi:hypothetical protein